MLNVQRISIYDTDVSIVWPSLLICINNGAESINCHISSKRIDVIITCILFVHTHIHGDQWSHHLIYYMSIFIYLFTIYHSTNTLTTITVRRRRLLHHYHPKQFGRASKHILFTFVYLFVCHFNFTFFSSRLSIFIKKKNLINKIVFDGKRI